MAYPPATKLDRRRPGDDPGGPRGLWPANQLCDPVQIRSVPGGTAFRVRKFLPPKA